MAKQNGAKVIKDIWEEKDEFGVVRFATVQTVSEISVSELKFSCGASKYNLFSVRRYSAYFD